MPADELRRAGVVLELGGHRAETLEQRRPDRAQPGRVAAAGRRRRGPRRRRAGHRRAGAGVALAGRPHRRHHRHQGQVDDHHAHRPDARRRRPQGGGRRQHRRAAVGAGRRRPTPDVIHVVEASSFQLETTEQFRPWIAVLLNLSADHLDRHASLEEYAAAKGRIFANQQADDFAVVNVDDAPSQALAPHAARGSCRSARRRRSPTASSSRADAIAHRRAGVDTPLVPVSAVRLLGRHLLTDVAAAAAVAEIAGVEPGGDGARRRGLHRPRARARTGRRRSRASASSTTRRPPTSSRRRGPSRASTTGWS